MAYVPPAMGKTTACYAIMKKYVKKDETNRGICFSPNDTSRPYLEHMMELLGFTDPENPPSGLVACLLDTLEVSPTGKLPSILILDDFMPNGPTNIDINLLLAIKTKVRSMNVSVVVMTANKESADLMLTMNDLASIIPLVDPEARRSILADFRQGQYKRGDASFHVDWETYLSMEWDKKEMKKAVLEDPSFKEKSVQERQDLAKEIDALFVQCTDEERKKLTPL